MSLFCPQTSFQDRFVTFRPIPAQTVSLGTTSVASLINTTNEIITLRHTSSGLREVSLFSLSESQDQTYRRLWCSQPAIASRREIDAALTAVLPLEFNSLIFGYSRFVVFLCRPCLMLVLLGDGRLHHTSFSALAITSPKSPSESPSSSSIQPIDASPFQNASNIPIPASICSLHLIRNERTGDRFIIGGSDDGGIAVWSLQ